MDSDHANFLFFLWCNISICCVMGPVSTSISYETRSLGIQHVTVNHKFTLVPTPWSQALLWLKLYHSWDDVKILTFISYSWRNWKPPKTYHGWGLKYNQRDKTNIYICFIKFIKLPPKLGCNITEMIYHRALYFAINT